METPRHNALSHSSLRLEAEKILNKFEKSQKDMKPLSPNQIQRTLHELHVYQIELEMQNEALRRAEETLLSERKHYFELYNLAPVVGYTRFEEESLGLNLDLSGVHYGAQAGAIVRIVKNIEIEGGYRYLVETGSDSILGVDVDADDLRMWYVGANFRF